MNIGLFFGSFNPIHTGHMIIANITHEVTNSDEIWFVVSPQNPHKRNKNLLHEFDRLNLVETAIADDFHFRACDIEFHLHRPSYTVDTLTVLAEKYPQHHFKLIMGEDNLASFPRWKNYQVILEEYGLIVYPRPEASKTDLIHHPNVKVIDAPKMDISATLIRKMIRAEKSIKYLVPQGVEERIRGEKLFL